MKKYYKIEGIGLDQGLLTKEQCLMVFAILDAIRPDHDWCTEDVSIRDVNYGALTEYTDSEVLAACAEFARDEIETRTGETYKDNWDDSEDNVLSVS